MVATKASKRRTNGVPLAANGLNPSLENRPSRAELFARGESLRRACPRRSHAEWRPAPARPTAVELVQKGNIGRIPSLVPIRHGRMIQSPFTYFRALHSLWPWT